MERFEILCVTMHQNDFSKIRKMNIHSNVVFANQCDHTCYDELEFEGNKAKMISTNTRGVGINRNLALTYATGDVCLFADDDVVYLDDAEEIVMSEFSAHPDADVFIFHLDTTDPQRTQVSYNKTKKCGPLTRMPWGGFRIAVRLSAQRRANLWFSTLYGGGAVFPSGEDSKWLLDAKRAGLVFYVSKETIGTVSFETSTWFTGYDEKLFYGKGAWSYATYKHTFFIWKWYYIYRYMNKGDMSISEKLKWMNAGKKGYQQMLSFEDYCRKIQACKEN